MLCGPLVALSHPRVMTALGTKENSELPSRAWMRGWDHQIERDHEEGMVVRTTKEGRSVLFFCKEVLESYLSHASCSDLSCNSRKEEA